MTINNFEHLENSVWDWAILDGCFGDSKIKVSDLDGIVERNGHFLVFECKFKPQNPIPTGQEILIKSLIATNHFTVIVLWGDKKPEEMQIYYPNGIVTNKQKANLEDLRGVVSRWYKYASKDS